MAVKPTNQLELELRSSQKSLDEAQPAASDGSKVSATVLSFAPKARQTAQAEERQLLDAISERAAHLFHFLRRDS